MAERVGNERTKEKTLFPGKLLALMKQQKKRFRCSWHFLLSRAHVFVTFWAQLVPFKVSSPYELSVVVWFLRQQLHFPPVEELVQSGEGILGDGTLIGVTPHLQAHEGHPDVQGPVELSTSSACHCKQRQI